MRVQYAVSSGVDCLAVWSQTRGLTFQYLVPVERRPCRYLAMCFSSKAMADQCSLENRAHRRWERRCVWN
jgi:hypothetical protein